MSDQNARMTILQMIEDGKISAEEGLRLLQAISGDTTEAGESTPSELLESTISTTQIAEPIFQQQNKADAAQDPEVENIPPPDTSHAVPPEMERWRNFWMVPLWIGMGVTVVSGILMYLAMQNSGLGFWFACATTPFVIGVVLMALAWQTRRAHWLHLRIQQKPGESPHRISLSFPLPLRFLAWFLRVFRHRIPKLDENLKEKSVDEMLMALDKTTTPQNPLFVHVDEGENGEKVTIYIG